MPKPNVCRTQAQKDAKLNAALVSRILALGMTSDEVGRALGVTGRTVNNWTHDPSVIPIKHIRGLNRLLRKRDETLVIPLEVYG